MKKIYKSLLVLSVLFTFKSNAQVLVPFTGSNTASGGKFTLCSHAGCGVTYNPNAHGYTVIYPDPCDSTRIVGSYNVESCCDYVRIFNGVGTGGTQLANYAGVGTFTFIALKGQTITVLFHSDGSVQNSGFTSTVSTAPSVSINNGITNYTICTGESVTLTATGAENYTWTPFALGNSIIASPMTSTSYTVLGGYNSYSCTATATANIIVNITPTISISGKNVVCGPNDNAPLTVNGAADVYTWSNGDEGPYIIVHPFEVTTYTVVATNTVGGCTDTDFIEVAFSTNPLVSVMASTTEICAGASVNLFASGATTYTWMNNANTSFITVTPNTTNIYQVMGSNEYGCVASATIPVIVNPLPKLNVLSSSQEICAGESVQLTGSGANTYQWVSPSFFLPSPVAVVTLYSTTVFTLNGVSAKGCTAAATLAQSVLPCTSLNENSGAQLLQLYPNPNNGSFKIAGTSDNDKVQITDVTGKVVLNATLLNGENVISINDFPAGLYFVNLESAGHTQTVKMIKE